MEKDALAQRIRAFRKLKGFTQQELAEQLGVSLAILGAVERGSRTADVRLLRKISEALRIDPDELTASGAYIKE